MFGQTGSIDRERLGVKVQALLAVERRQLWLLPLFIVVVAYFPMVLPLVGGHRDQVALRLALPTLFAIGGFVLFRRAAQQLLRAAEHERATKGDLDFYRDALDRRIAGQRRLRWLPLATSPLLALALWWRAPDLCLPAGLAVGMSWLALVVAQFVRLPRLLRDRAELG